MKRGIFIVVSLLALLSFAGRSEAIPAYPGELKHTQPNGAEVVYYAHGDEFMNWKTDRYGRLVDFGDTPQTMYTLYYADWTSASSVNSALSASAGEAPAAGSVRVEATVPRINDPVVNISGGVSPAPVVNNPPEYLADLAREAARERDEALRGELESAGRSPSLPRGARGAPAFPSTDRRVLVIYVKYPGDSRISGLSLGGSSAAEAA
ncbi:MAG: hypothetical protein LBQ56_06810, partial [Synergistaceae bacterium]|nr:hypothetical protein [Synergistaceae bacterium]